MSYSNNVSVIVNSAISGQHHDIESLAELKLSCIGVLREWANDDDLQYLRIVSKNIGFVRTYEKQYAGRGEGLT